MFPVVSLLACTSPSDGDTDGGDTASVEDTGTEVIGDADTDTDTDSDTDGDTDTDTEDHGDDDAAYAAFFDLSVLQRVDLTLSEEALAALREDPETYVSATFEHDGTTVEEVGVKLTGGGSTFDDIDGKPSFKVKMSEYHDHRDYAGLDKVDLHNMKGDDAQGREIVALAVWAAAGYPAPRASYAEVYVNGVSYGLYANVEEVDETFLDRRGLDEADLWEASSGADLTPDGVNHLDLVAGEGDANALVAARRQIQLGEGAFYDVADGVLDMAGFLDFWAWQVAIANKDAYPYDLDDFYLYADPTIDGRFRFWPAGSDEAFEHGMDWEDYTGTLAVHCAYDTACLATMKEHVSAVLTAYEGLDVNGIATAAFTLSIDAMNADTKRETPAADVLTARATLLTDVTGRPNVVRGQMGL